MTTMITGAAGFIGRHLTSTLLAEGVEVIGVDNFITSDREDLAALLRTPGFSFYEMDVTSPAFREMAQSRPVDHIYHLACPTGVPNLGPLALEMLETCFDGTRAVLDVARMFNATVVLSSSAEVYGNPLVSPQDESYTGNVDTLGPRNGYEEGKRVAETLCGIYAQRYGADAKIARIFNTYGPGMSLRETRVVPAFVRAALRSEPITVHGDGSQLRCHTYVADMVDGLRRLASGGRAGIAYNLGSRTPMSVRALAEEIVRVASSTSPIQSIARPVHDHDARLPRTERALQELGWAPTTTLERGLRATVEDIAGRLARMEPATHAVAPGQP
jgi:nucleoside-diphosphate-sugar epimerase